MEEFAVQDILTILSRRRKYFFIAAAIVFVISMIFALSWSHYRSVATVQIEQSYIPANVTSAGGSSNDMMMALADQRIGHIEQKVTSQESLADIITKYNLFPGTRESTPISQLTDTMRKKIKLQLVSSIMSNPAAAMKETAEQLSAIAFSLSFDYSDPLLTQQVLGELVTRFQDEDIKQRRTQAAETSAFLTSQISQLEDSMAEQEKTIAEFRATHGESGAASLTFNQQASATAAMNIQSINSQITANEATQGNIRGQLATTEPYTRVLADGQVLTTPAVQLRGMESQLTTLSAHYGPAHPDVIKLRHQIASLKSQMGTSDNSAQLEARIADTKTKLAAAQKTYGEDYPDVANLKRKLKKLEAELAAKPKPATNDDIVKHDADNPAYLQLVAQLMSSQEQHKSLLAQRDGLVTQQAKYAKSIADTPASDQEMARLTRDHDNASQRYRELKEKKMSADMMEQLELHQKGQRLVVINPPSIPGTTHPARSILILAGIVLSVMGGLGSVIIAELMRPSVHSANHLASLVGAMPLVVIPYMYSRVESNHVLRRWQSLSGITGSLMQLWKHACYQYASRKQK